MIIGQFITLLYKNSGESPSTAKEQYFLNLIDELIGDSDIENPFFNFEEDTLKRYYNLKTNRVNTDKLAETKPLIKQHNFKSYIDNLSEHSKKKFFKALNEYFTDVDEDNIGSYCEQLFIKLIDETIAKTATPSKKLSTIHIPIGNVYYDKTSHLLHIGLATTNKPSA